MPQPSSTALRWQPAPSPPPLEPCSRCGAEGCPWDRLDDAPVCPDCQQLILLGQTEPLRFSPIAGTCAVCKAPRILHFQTSPLRSDRRLELDLCGRHLQALLARRLSPRALHRLMIQLHELGLTCRQIFLLHESFYDPRGRALQPVPETI